MPIRWDEFIDVHFPTFCIIVSLSSILALPEYNILYSILQSVLIYLYSYGVHYLLHYLALNYSVFNTYEPHVAIHHNKNIILPRWLELTIETMSNLFSILLILIVQYIFNIDLFSKNSVIFIAIFYTSIHIFHYSLYEDEIHRKHHTNKFCNFEPRVFDVLFNTRCDPDSPYVNNINEIPHSLAAFIFVYLLKLYFNLE